ncbi:hypothetical protein PMKS-003932 [Pichia membranifaciens]|uniref:Xylanolytic transcriptional activator regulatory domain-containing protein n=1 Tax=Pichia membranifaciens TaxID=4926 RepID=A0A1Q2YLK5_9ASCO|nr:hypothetical protein PMKS-003932 [Pichia membranifaciens]
MSEIAELDIERLGSEKMGGYGFQRFGLHFPMEELADEYPKKEEFDEIIDLYWEYVHPLVPIIDKESTVGNYHIFWQEFNDEENPRFDIDSGILFLSMLFAVKTAFEVNEKNPDRIQELKQQKNNIYNIFEKFKLVFGFISNANLSFIQASLILYQSGCIYYIGIFTYTASLARQAEFMGLHRDPFLHDVHPNKDLIRDVEIKRAVWHYIRFLDTATSITAGMSPHMIMTNSSTRFPSKRDYNPDSQQFDGDLNPFMIFTICRFKCSLVMETISHYLNSDFSSDQEKQLRWESITRTVMALYQDINALVKEIFSCSSNPKYSNVLLRWLVSNAAIIVHRTYLLHIVCDRRPYSHQNRVILKPLNGPHIGLTNLSRANSNREFFEQILTIRMPYHGAGVEVSMLLLYETSIRVGVSPELSKFKWFTKTANPFQYIYFILRDIYHYPTKVYKFTHIPKQIKSFIFDDDLLNCEGDIRKYTVDISLNALYRLKDHWSDPISDMMNFLLELRKFVYKSIANRNQVIPNSDINPEGCDVEPDSTFEMDKYRSIYNLLSTLNEEPSSGSNVESIHSAKHFLNENGLLPLTRDTSASDFMNMKYNINEEQKDFFPPKLSNSLNPNSSNSPLDFSSDYVSANPHNCSTYQLPSLQKSPAISPIQKLQQMPQISPIHFSSVQSPTPPVSSMQSPYMHPIGTLPPVPNNSGRIYHGTGKNPDFSRKEGVIYDSAVLTHTPNISNTRLKSTISMEGRTSTSSTPPHG